jgi:hypothetical protein
LQENRSKDSVSLPGGNQSMLMTLLGLLMLSIAGCGTSVSAGPTGVFVDTSTESFLRKSFSETKACGAFKDGVFEDVSVVFMPPTFPCKHYASGCSGEYINPNFLKVGSLYVWKHEVLHFLLDVNTGDPDPAHRSTLFQNCV